MRLCRRNTDFVTLGASSQAETPRSAPGYHELLFSAAWERRCDASWNHGQLLRDAGCRWLSMAVDDGSKAGETGTSVDQQRVSQTHRAVIESLITLSAAATAAAADE